MSAQNIEKRTTPCVPTPDWSTNLNNEMEIGNKHKGGINKDQNLQDVTMKDASVISKASVTPAYCEPSCSWQTAVYSEPSCSWQTPAYSEPSCSSKTTAYSEPTCSSKTAAHSEPSCSSKTTAYSEPTCSSKTAAHSEPSCSSKTTAYSEPSCSSKTAAHSEPSCSPKTAAYTEPSSSSKAAAHSESSCSSKTPAYSEPSCSSQTTPAMPTSQSYIAGEVALTPTHSTVTPQTTNPHSTMSAITPMVSGTDEARNSIKVQNCVATVNLGCELKLLDIYCKTRFSEYNPARFHGVVMKIVEPRATALVFRSGKILCTGLKNEHDSYMAARKFARVIQKLGFPAKFLDFKIQNFIATADLRFPIRLEALQQSHGQFASYEPELFPGLVYRMVRPRVVLLIFVNGKIVFTGGKTRNEIHDALDIIYPILRSYRIS